MDTHFEELMSKKSEDGLMEYITNLSRYTPESILAAVEELKKRGRHFTNEELAYIKLNIDEKIIAQKNEDEMWSIRSFKKDIEQTLKQTPYYLKGIIRGSSEVLAVKLGKKSFIRTLILFSVIALAFVPINFATLLFLWMFYGESAQGSIDSANVYQLFPIRHLPIVLPIILLSAQSIANKLWIYNREKLKSNIFVAVGALILYVLFESFELFYS